jgi:hypothetical protein
MEAMQAEDAMHGQDQMGVEEMGGVNAAPLTLLQVIVPASTSLAEACSMFIFIRCKLFPMRCMNCNQGSSSTSANPSLLHCHCRHKVSLLLTSRSSWMVVSTQWRHWLMQQSAS